MTVRQSARVCYIQRRMHIKKRARSRCRLRLNNQNAREIIGMIEGGQAEEIYRKSCSRAIYAVFYGGTLLFPVYGRGVLYTFLPPTEQHIHEWLRKW